MSKICLAEVCGCFECMVTALALTFTNQRAKNIGDC